jgi:hypothetical protein
MIRIEDRTGIFRLHYDGADVDILGKLLGLIKEFIRCRGNTLCQLM